MKLLLLILLIIAILISSCIVESKKQHNNEETHFKQLGNCQLNQTSKYKKISSRSEVDVLVGEQLTASELKKHESYMKIVLDIARSNKVKFASIIVSPDDRVLCSGIFSKENPILHSELVAITNCSSTYSMKSFENHTIYSTSEPDSLSASAILYARFKTVVFGSFIKDLYCKACFSNLPIDSSYIFSRGYGIGVNDVKLIGGILQEQTDINFGSYCDDSKNSVYKTKPECRCKSPKSQDDEGNPHGQPHNSENTHNNDGTDSFFNEQHDNYRNKKVINEDSNESDKSNKKHKGDKKHSKHHSSGHYSHHSHKSKDGRSSTSTSSYSSGNGHASASASASSSSSPNSNSYSHSHSHSPKKEHNHKKDKNNNNKGKKDNEKRKSKSNKHSSSSNELNIEKNI